MERQLWFKGQMHTVIVGTILLVGLALWVAAGGHLRKLYRVSREQLRHIPGSDQGC